MPLLELCPASKGQAGGTRNFCIILARSVADQIQFIADLKGMVKEHLRAWYNCEKQKTLPTHILFYRDGVSDSQFGMVSCEEFPQIQTACTEIGTEFSVKCEPKITLLVVTKRHHARFLPDKSVAPGGAGDTNLGCGTVVDTKVVAPHMWNFYLQSHHSELGTARGAHYVVIHDDAKYTNFEIQHIVSHLDMQNQVKPYSWIVLNRQTTYVTRTNVQQMRCQSVLQLGTLTSYATGCDAT